MTNPLSVTISTPDAVTRTANIGGFMSQAALLATVAALDDILGGTSTITVQGNIGDSFILPSIAKGITATGGITNSNFWTDETLISRTLSHTINFVETVASSGDAVRLPVPVAGRLMVVVNKSRSNSLTVYPYNTDCDCSASWGVDDASHVYGCAVAAGRACFFIGIDTVYFWPMMSSWGV